MENEIYEMGVKAYYAGALENENPYNKTLRFIKYWNWKEGYNDAQRSSTQFGVFA